MAVTPEIEFSSVLSPYIEGHIKEKRALGFDYRTEEMILLRFDLYCVERKLTSVNVTKSFLDDWCVQLDTEGPRNQRKRIDAVRHLMLYMISLGIEVYVPKFTGHLDTVVPHIFTESELQAFFDEVDSYNPDENHPIYKRMAAEYKVLFRMIYCCGLRNSEGCSLAVENVNLKNGTLDILGSKRNKDRRVYMAEDLTKLCGEYYEYLCDSLHAYPQWFFPGKNTKNPLKNMNLDAVFSRFWNQTSYAATCNNKPTVHDLRFTFITNRINCWVSQGLNLEVMMPYLEKYVGHKSLRETYYYYHNTEQLYKSIQDIGKTSELCIPEVKKYE
ncbi:MAG: tyrosine-type recombinase/integrase [Clostridia bacterium]|nr:tyrosine-type recombinase/integrase [Clostridia bacterium]